MVLNEIQVHCPTCDKIVSWHKGRSPYRPFCSERCRLIDLGEWASGEKYIPSQEKVSESDEDQR
ncbi:DNA gyrase inhibitor YacG [Candidatus Fukatsuia symbiotica]|uniref:DNA gyrase inhibitor YacG n=1 Tax=Candidatus Fukatsuia symbiotica TaxID=1878942 RepID=A0A2U8I2S9_9GAMM|nr:DNA gyrase inhibitor YacG [Candidatus Fukatsuia symbiotica]AWK13413.1 DNA gyrase inhibitor YacG [Candidatus Fukatsuia symbiotica]MEA9444305.1 DNA gyrase inhibitor YacG [Candidatus Fukatsuia symbiotica]